MFIIILLCILTVVFSLFFKKSNFLYVLTFLFAWSIMAFVYGNADEGIYISRYSQQSLWVGETEFLYAFIIRLSNLFKLSFYQFKAFITLIQLLLISATIRKYAKYPAFVLALYMIYPFALNVCQMRNALATAIMLFALRFILVNDIDQDNKKLLLALTKNDLLYILFILIATGVHTVAIVWILLLVAKKISLKFTIIFTVIFNMLFAFVFTPENLLKILSLFGAMERIATYFTKEYRRLYQSVYFHSAIIRVSAYTILILAIYIWLKKKYKEENSALIEYAIKTNIIVLCIVSVMINYTTEIYRIQEGITILNYIVISGFIRKNSTYKIALKPRNVLVSISLCVFSFANLWMIALRDQSMIETVIQPLFSNNFLFELFEF